MGRIGSQRTLYLQGLTQALQQLIHVIAHHPQLQRHSFHGQRLQVTATARRNLSLQHADRAQLSARHRRDQPGHHWQHHQQHQAQPNDRALAGLLALLQRIRQLQPDTVLCVVQAKYAEVLGVKKTRVQRHCKRRRRRCLGTHQYLPCAAAQLQQKWLRMVGAGQLPHHLGITCSHFRQCSLNAQMRPGNLQL